MSYRLIKVAKELNVGTSTIVEFLHSKGFDVENKPTAQVSEEMHVLLLKEFSNSIEEKVKADKLVIGSRIEEAPKPEPKPIVKEVIPAPKPAVVEPVVAKTDQTVPDKPTEEAKVEPVVDPPKIGLKVVDKINLDKVNIPKPEPKETAVPIKESAAPTATTDDEPKGEEMVRAKIPQLEGLKIKGKIDTKKFEERPKKAVKTVEEVKATPSTSKPKRKRKKISAENLATTNRRPTGNTTQGRPRSNNREEDKQVSAKEVEEKLKATMAKIAGGKSNKRQRIRRDSRDVKRERQEEMDSTLETGAIQVTEFISVSELASLLDISPTEIIMTCMNMGVIVSINQRLDAEIIEIVAEEYNKEVVFISAEEQLDIEEEDPDDPADLVTRGPIVTVMGHVDHGKTSLLDYIRQANVVSGEAGGITQHIGAYEVKVGDTKVTFLDTPGHEAFTAMRARGAKVTDVAIIIVAADDRIMPQTKEAISHAQAAGVPMIFAINKIDKDGANPTKIKEELSSMNILVEEWGGKFQSQDISAKTGVGIPQLLDKIILESEILDLKANPDRNAQGTIIEASLDKGRGYVTKILVQNGSLELGNVIVAGSYSGKIKAMFNEKGGKVKKVGPSTPVLILGLNGAPQAGEKFKEVESDQEARQIAAKRQQIEREQSNRANKRISLDEIGRRLALGNFRELNLIIKGDVDGSIEALSDALIKQSIETVQVNIIHKAVGQIVESDVLLASASDAIIIGFQVRPSSIARQLAEKEGVEIKTYSIIYEAIDEIRSAIEGMLEPTKEEKITSEVQVREVYKISKIGTIAGCYVSSGIINRNHYIRVIRDGIVVYPTKEGANGEISSLKRFKDDAKEVRTGLECGITIKNYNDIQVNDVIEGYEIIEIKQTLK